MFTGGTHLSHNNANEILNANSVGQAEHIVSAIRAIAK